METLLKDLLYNMQAYIHWHDEYRCEGEWTCIKNMNNHLERVSELLPQVLSWVNNDELDEHCG